MGRPQRSQRRQPSRRLCRPLTRLRRRRRRAVGVGVGAHRRGRRHRHEHRAGDQGLVQDAEEAQLEPAELGVWPGGCGAPGLWSSSSHWVCHSGVHARLTLLPRPARRCGPSCMLSWATRRTACGWRAAARCRWACTPRSSASTLPGGECWPAAGRLAAYASGCAAATALLRCHAASSDVACPPLARPLATQTSCPALPRSAPLSPHRSPLFFKLKNLKAASLEITAMLGMVAATIYEFSKVRAGPGRQQGRRACGSGCIGPQGSASGRRGPNMQAASSTCRPRQPTGRGRAARMPWLRRPRAEHLPLTCKPLRLATRSPTTCVCTGGPAGGAADDAVPGLGVLCHRPDLEHHSQQ